MPKRTRIYTRTGDAGQTGLFGGQRVSKSSQRIECFGAIDECSSAIGLARHALRNDRKRKPRAAALEAWLGWTQDVLFDLGAELATPRRDESQDDVRVTRRVPRIAHRDVEALESAIDQADASLAPLDTFILPGGSLAGGFLHLARALCRRAERNIVRLAETETVEPVVLTYVNRLSDALFVWARWINDAQGMAEHRWRPSSSPPAVSLTARSARKSRSSARRSRPRS